MSRLLIIRWSWRTVRARWARVALLAALLWCVATRPAPAQRVGRAAVAAVDSIARAAVASGRVAGMTIAVVRGRDTLLLHGYGAADLELAVPTPDNAEYEIGSLTKQFTAVAIMQLMERGRLSLDDDVTRFVAGVDTHGRHVSIRQLLTHTSGIFDYVSLNGFIRRARVAIAADSLVALFNAEPPRFAPGVAMAYSNSNYVLLGLVIERASGMSYADYVRAQLFERAGMSTASYCSTDRIVPRAAHGYDMGDAGLRHAAYLDFSWVYAAGALCASAGDLVRWLHAMHDGRLLGPVAYRALITPDTLADGTPLRYAAGVAVDSLLGHRAVHHGGDIPGFASELTWLPDDSLGVVVLMNTEGPVRPDELTREIIRAVLGDRSSAARPLVRPPREYAGDYVATVGERRFRIDTDSASSRLTLRIGTGAARPLRFLGDDTFARGDVRVIFRRVRGQVAGLTFDNVYDVTPAIRQAPGSAIPRR